MLVIPDQWIDRLTAHQGEPPRKDADLDRWLWDDGEWGVYVERLTHAWQSVAWSPTRSVTLRTATDPDQRDIMAVARLAGFTATTTEAAA